ncbi:porin [Paraburkholderia sp. 1N]|uniref:Porin n=1 Tax=Paraburkholderia solitsugae TaxID=2675748 RepID=A0ABX2BKR4_9BURK|nr:porin [Paraburkholderia solitsugae]NPT40526.1 porin [Paraburkholderia solitsugae]
MKKQWVASALIFSFAGIASAQSSVTIYGIVDAGITYRSNERTGSPGAYTGHSNFSVTSGNQSGSRWGLKGKEDLGGGWNALFQLEDGFDVTNGKILQNGGLFGRQAFVGIGSTQYGTITLGRQYTSLNDFLAPVSPIAYIGGFGAHPGDIDDLDQTARVNNSIKYMSASYSGFTFGALYGFGGQPGSLKQQNTWSVGAGYGNGPLNISVGYERSDNSKSGPKDTTLGKWNGSDDGLFNSSINEGYASAQSQQIVEAGVTYDFGSALVGLNYSNVQYRSGAESLFNGIATFNIAGVFAQWKIRPNIRVFGGYSYTRGGEVDGIEDRAQYHNVTIGAMYNLTKRSVIYVLSGYQHASGGTLDALGNPVPATASVSDKGNGHSSATQSQVIVSFGIRHQF